MLTCWKLGIFSLVKEALIPISDGAARSMYDASFQNSNQHSAWCPTIWYFLFEMTSTTCIPVLTIPRVKKNYCKSKHQLPDFPIKAKIRYYLQIKHSLSLTQRDIFKGMSFCLNYENLIQPKNTLMSNNFLMLGSLFSMLTLVSLVQFYK